MSFAALLFAASTAFAEEPPAAPTTDAAPATEMPAETPVVEAPPAPENPCANLADDALKVCETARAVEKAQAELASVPDCATLTGDDQTRCTQTRSDLERRIASLQEGTSPVKGKKAKKAKKSKKSMAS
jgi:hypothetical protein